ncbi:carbon-nitrogen hydrolase family protein [Xenorhabdus sp. PB61.4]|uniref:carbon-nitrogen hydrolase family protein n=1 Tax=Xenorhabdus sp. PB61.4 TaxID=2788940 RepID=UPI001E4BE26E|nr:carbon-nitrogen hydrolase family protein [Xenorhabdus sp. PB61.4]MCC8368029.1 carbon-nitrogen hydrolase family protein [Xenorhabdus sp. PB61.4]
MEFIKEHIMQGNFIIAAAQFSPVRGNVEENTRMHQRLISAAASEKANAIIFPELSLTGYEHDLAKELAFTDADTRLEPFRILAREYNITIIVGAPVNTEGNKPQIGVFVVSSDTPVFHYSKIYLHPGEDKFFTPGSDVKVFQCHGQSLGLAICADTGVAAHAHNTATMGASAYLSSVLITESGYYDDTAKLQNYAKKYGMAVVMANYSGLSGGFNAIGKSAIWDENGRLIIEAPEAGSCVVIAKLRSTNPAPKVIYI